MSALASTLSSFGGPSVGIGGGHIWVCGEPLQFADDPFASLTATDVLRHGDQMVASPWASAKSSPGAERLEQMGLNPQPLPPREVGIDALGHIDDFCGTQPKRTPPPPPPGPGPLGAGALRLQELVETQNQNFGSVFKCIAEVASLETVRSQVVFNNPERIAQMMR